MSVCVSKILVDYNNPRILEAGCGSGKATILLEPDCEKTLLDISPSALKYAKFLSDQFGAKNINYIQGDIFKMPFQSEEFDLVWNIGVLEHYDNKYIIDILCEMIRVTKRNGIISFGVPNSFSLPIIKAKILKYWFLRFIPGYRIHTDLIPGK